MCYGRMDGSTPNRLQNCFLSATHHFPHLPAIFQPVLPTTYLGNYDAHRQLPLGNDHLTCFGPTLRGRLHLCYFLYADSEQSQPDSLIDGITKKLPPLHTEQDE